MDSTMKSMEEIMFLVEIKMKSMGMKITFMEIEMPLKAMTIESMEIVTLSLVKAILLWVKEILSLDPRHHNNKSKPLNKWSNKES